MQSTNSSVVQYMECSARTQTGVDEVFEEAARIILSRNKQEERKCTVL